MFLGNSRGLIKDFREARKEQRNSNTSLRTAYRLAAIERAKDRYEKSLDQGKMRNANLAARQLSNSIDKATRKNRGQNSNEAVKHKIAEVEKSALNKVRSMDHSQDKSRENLGEKFMHRIRGTYKL